MIRRFLQKALRVSVTVNTTKRRESDFEKRRAERCQQLADEIGYPWPPRKKEPAQDGLR